MDGTPSSVGIAVPRGTPQQPEVGEQLHSPGEWYGRVARTLHSPPQRTGIAEKRLRATVPLPETGGEAQSQPRSPTPSQQGAAAEQPHSPGEWYGRVARQRFARPQPLPNDQQWRRTERDRSVPAAAAVHTAPPQVHADSPRARRIGQCVQWTVAGLLALAAWVGAQIQQEQQREMEAMGELQMVADAVAAPRLGVHSEDRADWAPRNQSGVGRRDSAPEANEPWAEG